MTFVVILTEERHSLSVLLINPLAGVTFARNDGLSYDKSPAKARIMTKTIIIGQSAFAQLFHSKRQTR